MAKVADKKKKTALKKEKVTYHRRPDELRLDMWQYKLRLLFGAENSFNVTGDTRSSFFTSYEVYNPASKSTYTTCITAAIPTKGLPATNSIGFRNNYCNCQDFRTNRLGLCKHISATIHWLSAKRGFKTAIKKTYRPEFSAIYVDYRRSPSVRLLVGSEHEVELLEWSEAWFDDQGYLLEGKAASFDQLLQEARAIQKELVCEPDAMELVLQSRENSRRARLLADIIGKEVEKSPLLDSLVNVPLFAYQKHGIQFAATAGRCIIADEMGLGKTIQAIGAAVLLQQKMGIEKVVIVCPSSLKYQWKMEIEKFTGVEVDVVEGTMLKRHQNYKENKAFFQVISYNVATNDRIQIADMKPDLLIIDEAQRLKNFRTKVSIELKKIATPYCFVLTGTPLENKLEELYAITQLVDQYRFPPLYSFLDRYQLTGESGQVRGYQHLKEISGIMGSCMIRRQKKEVWKQLPQRINKTLYVPMTLQQRNIHTELSDYVAQIVAKWHRYHYLSEQDRKRLILLLSQMRMVCDSTFILDQKTRHDTKIDELLYIFEEALTNPEQKIVVFSQWERMTRLVAAELEARNVGFANLNGSVPSRDRQQLLERFTHDPNCRVFVSTDAGATGLNLQVASMVINLDIPWNPALLEQRVGRILRIGQERNITVINMVSTGTIEERMLGVLAFKSSMAEGVLDPEGDDTIIMSENRFKKFMEQVEGIAESGLPIQEDAAENTANGEPADIEDYETIPDAAEVPSNTKPTPPATAIPGDDDIPVPDTAQPQPVAQSSGNTTQQHNDIAQQSPQQLVQAGMSFLSGLAETLKSPEKTQALVHSIVAKDETTGQTYLKIPIENADIVQNMFQLLGSLLGTK